jgi:nickel transport protein
MQNKEVSMNNIPTTKVGSGWVRVLALGIGIGLLLFTARVSFAHGVELSYEAVKVVEITARFDSGDPMAGGQVAVFSPDDPVDPWLTGTCDDEGKFYFTPDPTRSGLWEIQVRLAGHGDLIRMEISGDGSFSAGTTGYTILQKLVMVAAVIWGWVGTALFFSRRKN